MKVALCDDDVIFLEDIKQKLSEYECEIYTFNSAKELIESDILFDIAFLDIELENNTTSFPAVKFLRMRNKKCIIAFFTNYDQYAIEGYDYRAFRYILKKEPEQLINKRINDVFKEYSRIHKTFTGTYGGYSFSVELDDIYYIQSDNHILTLHTVKGEFELYKQMKNIEKELCEFDFVRCHRRYIVNMKHINIMRNDYCFVLSDGKNTSIPIGITYRKNAESQYLNFVSLGG